MYYKFQIFLRLELKHRLHLISILVILAIFSSTIFLIPIKNPVEYALAYQRDDVTAIVDTGIVNKSNIDANLVKLQQSTPVEYTVTKHYVSSIALMYNGNFDMDNINVRVDFKNTTPSLQIISLWYRPIANNSITFGNTEIHFVQVEELKNPNSLGKHFDGILTLPLEYEANITLYYFGLNIDPIAYKGLNFNTIKDQFNNDIASIDFNIQSIFGVSLVDAGIPVKSAFEEIENNYPTIILQNFILIISLLAGLVVLLYFMYQSSLSKNLKLLEILYHRGYSEKNIYQLLPVFFVGFHTILSLLMSALIFFTTVHESFHFQYLLPTTLVILLSLIATYNALREFRKLQPQDATDYELPPTILEYAFLILTIISFLVNILYNVPLFRYNNLILVQTIYFTIGLACGGIIFKILQYFRRKLINRYSSMEILSQNGTNFLYFTKIQLIQYRKYLKIAILFGIIFVVVVAHTNISYQMSQESQKNTTLDLLYAQYNQYQDIRKLQNIHEEFTGLLPATMNKLGTLLSGAIITDNSIFSMFDSLKKVDTTGPVLYFRSDLKSSQYSALFDIHDISSIFQLGENNFNLKIDPTGYFSSNEYILNRFEFLLFVSSDYYSNYNSSLNLLISTGQQSTLQIQEEFENNLPQSIKWLKYPELTPSDYSLRGNIEEQIDFPVLFVVIVFITIFIGFVEPLTIISSELVMMRLRGFINKQSFLGAFESSLLTIFVLGIISILGNVIILGLIQYFNILPALDIHVWTPSSVIIPLILGGCWLIGNIWSYFLIFSDFLDLGN